MSQAQENARDLREVENSIDAAKVAIKRKDALERLEKNRDFKLLILDGFLKDHAVRQVMLKAHPDVIGNEKSQAIFDAQITAIGNFRQFLVSINALGAQAQADLPAHESTRDEIMAEDLTNG